MRWTSPGTRLTANSPRYCTTEMRSGRARSLVTNWPRRDSNPYEAYASLDFKSNVSANSTTRPGLVTRALYGAERGMPAGLQASLNPGMIRLPRKDYDPLGQPWVR